MNQYIVKYNAYEVDNYFVCFAEDFDDAKEQFTDAYYFIDDYEVIDVGIIKWGGK